MSAVSTLLASPSPHDARVSTSSGATNDTSVAFANVLKDVSAMPQGPGGQVQPVPAQAGGSAEITAPSSDTGAPKASVGGSTKDGGRSKGAPDADPQQASVPSDPSGLALAALFQAAMASGVAPVASAPMSSGGSGAPQSKVAAPADGGGGVADAVKSMPTTDAAPAGVMTTAIPGSAAAASTGQSPTGATASASDSAQTPPSDDAQAVVAASAAARPNAGPVRVAANKTLPTDRLPGADSAGTGSAGADSIHAGSAGATSDAPDDDIASSGVKSSSGKTGSVADKPKPKDGAAPDGAAPDGATAATPPLAADAAAAGAPAAQVAAALARLGDTPAPAEAGGDTAGSSSVSGTSAGAASGAVQGNTATTPSGAREMVIKLDPEHLGSVEIKMRMKGGTLDIEIRVANAQTLDVLSRDRHLLSAAVEAAGGTRDDFTLRGTEPAATPGGAGFAAGADDRSGGQQAFSAASSGRDGQGQSGASGAFDTIMQRDDENAPPVTAPAPRLDGGLYL